MIDFERCFDVLFTGQITQSADMCHVLPHQLIDQATLSQAENQDPPGLFDPIPALNPVAMSFSEAGGMIFLEVIFAVKNVFVRPFAS